MKVKIHGAGSIGNHLAQAARRMGWEVVVVDVDPKALERMKTDIYPSRYGAWDDAIVLYEAGAEPVGGFDMICIGTPPHVRMRLALAALEEKPRILFLEKPLTFPFDPDLRTFLERYRAQSEVSAVVGYDHAVGASIERVIELLKDETSIGEALTIDVEFREHWQGIFKAHPWLSGPADTYLGYWKKGGGASGEHSHALHLWRCLAEAAGFGAWKQVATMLDVKTEGEAEYDTVASFALRTESGKTGRVVQDVVTLPVRKWARIQGSQGFIEWICNGHPEGDLVRFAGTDGVVTEEIFKKKRPDDFYREMQHLEQIMRGVIDPTLSPLSFENGLAVMEVLEAAWTQHSQGTEIKLI